MESIAALSVRGHDPDACTALDLVKHLAQARTDGDMRLAEDCRLWLKSIHSISVTGRYTIAVGFDGILCENEWPRIGDARREIIGYLKMLRESYGVQLIFATPRAGDLYLAAREWCRAQGLTFDIYNENLPVFIERYGDDHRRIFADEHWMTAL